MKKPQKKITDKMRLDWLEALGPFIAIPSIQHLQKITIRGDVFYSDEKKFRECIDAAMRGEK